MSPDVSFSPMGPLKSEDLPGAFRSDGLNKIYLLPQRVSLDTLRTAINSTMISWYSSPWEFVSSSTYFFFFFFSVTVCCCVTYLYRAT